MSDCNILITEGSTAPSHLSHAALAKVKELAAVNELADARVIATDAEGTLLGHVALWWQEVPTASANPDKKLGVLGGFEAINQEVTTQILQHAEQHLGKIGCRMAIGPMNGNTWRKYRFVTDRNALNDRKPFFMEPQNRQDFPLWWEACGYRVLARYSSSCIDLTGPRRTVESPRLQKRLERYHISFRSLRPQQYEEELRRIYKLSVQSFTKNLFYTPLIEEEFLGMYHGVKSMVEPDFVQFAERDGEPCAFVFALPDIEARLRQEKPALIVKTLAVVPEMRRLGLGSLLVERVQNVARSRGYTEAIHALEHEANDSRKISVRNVGEIFRQYAPRIQ